MEKINEAFDVQDIFYNFENCFKHHQPYCHNISSMAKAYYIGLKKYKEIKPLSIFLLLLSNIFSTFAQHIECEKIEFCLLPATVEKIADTMAGMQINEDSFEEEKEEETEFSFGTEELSFKVRAHLKVSNLINDTITLKTTIKLSLLGPQNLNATLIDKSGRLIPLVAWIESQAGSQFFEDSQLLKIVVPHKKDASILVEYNVIGTSCFRYKPENKVFYSLHQRHENFYPDFPIKNIEIESPDSILTFISHIDKSNGTTKEINLAFLFKKRYVEKTIKGELYTINIHIPDTLINDEKIQQNISLLQQYIDKFSTYLPQKKVSDIIYINWRDDKNRRAFGESLGNYIVCDINFGSKDLLHEQIHSFLPIEVENLSKGEYFIKESIIEWLALFLSNGRIDPEKQVFKKSSIYDTHINNHTTWELIYFTGPSIIEQMALKCGREKMADTLVSFLEKNRKKVTNYDQFIRYLNKYLPNNLVVELDSLVKTSCEE